MNINIKAKRSVVRGVKMYEVEEISALTENDLPNEYMVGDIRVWMASDIMLNIKSRVCFTDLVVGQKYSASDMETRLDIIRAAGNRLHEINARLAKENEGWEGTHYWTI